MSTGLDIADHRLDDLHINRGFARRVDPLAQAHLPGAQHWTGPWWWMGLGMGPRLKPKGLRRKRALVPPAFIFWCLRASRGCERRSARTIDVENGRASGRERGCQYV